MSCKRVGVLGGTFDPIHNGHRDIGLAAAEEYELDRLIFMPAGDPYCKSDRQVTGAEHRLAMTRLAVASMPDFCCCSDLEIRMPGRTYTANTLLELKGSYPEAELFFIAGADSVLYMDKWYRPELVFENATVLCAKRPGSDMGLDAEIDRLNQKYGSLRKTAPILKLHTREQDISSTRLREMYSAGEDISPYVDQRVLEYIKENALYD